MCTVGYIDLDYDLVPHCRAEGAMKFAAVADIIRDALDSKHKVGSFGLLSVDITVVVGEHACVANLGLRICVHLALGCSGQSNSPHYIDVQRAPVLARQGASPLRAISYKLPSTSNPPEGPLLG